MPDAPSDQELAAIQAILTALNTLDREARGRVFEYVFSRFGISAPVSTNTSLTPLTGSLGLEGSAPLVATSRPGPTDIRSLRDEKQPRNAVEMAALVGYYLSELAPATEKRSVIGADDIVRYFKQARFPLPGGKPHNTLRNAKTAGYLEQQERGNYRLTPVGYNLVAHILGASPKKAGRPIPQRKKKAKTRSGR
jgi:hypothetical protein